VTARQRALEKKFFSISTLTKRDRGLHSSSLRAPDAGERDSVVWEGEADWSAGM